MSASDGLENGLLGLLFTATDYGTIADNDAGAPATNLYISLHTSDPGDTGDQTTGETSYTGYARIAVARSGSGWTVSSGTVTNDNEITFGQCTASPGSNITHLGIGLSLSGSGTLLMSGLLNNAIPMSVGTTPIISAGELSVSLD
jgi:hypothetical protein